MTLDRKNYSYLEREREEMARQEQEGGSTYAADSYYAERQRRMDESARAVMANLWCTHRPQVMDAEANNVLYQLASESWQIALALEQTRIGYDCQAMQSKRRDAEAAAKETVHNVD